MTHLVVTDGIVLGKREAGEDHTAVFIFTEELGLVRAMVRAARRESSKLRYGVEPFTAGRFSLVRGKREWKYVGGEHLSRDIVRAPAAVRAAAGRVARLVLRLVHGEERSSSLWSAVRDGFDLVCAAKDPRTVQAAEAIFVLRVLHALGYVAGSETLAPFLAPGTITGEMIENVAGGTLRPAIIRAVNDGLAASGL